MSDLKLLMFECLENSAQRNEINEHQFIGMANLIKLIDKFSPCLKCQQYFDFSYQDDNSDDEEDDPYYHICRKCRYSEFCYDCDKDLQGKVCQIDGNIVCQIDFENRLKEKVKSNKKELDSLFNHYKIATEYLFAVNTGGKFSCRTCKRLVPIDQFSNSCMCRRCKELATYFQPILIYK